jgi:hypothetical protein
MASEICLGTCGKVKPVSKTAFKRFPSIDNRGDIDHFAVWTDDTILVQEDLPMLVTLFPEGNSATGSFGIPVMFSKPGNEFANGDISRGRDPWGHQTAQAGW